MAVKAMGTVEHCCGHRRTLDLGEFPAWDRDRFAHYLATKECYDCWLASRQAMTVPAPAGVFDHLRAVELAALDAVMESQGYWRVGKKREARPAPGLAEDAEIQPSGQSPDTGMGNSPW